LIAASKRNVFFVFYSSSPTLRAKAQLFVGLTPRAYFEAEQCGCQGDQIGRIFTHCVIAYFEQFSVNYRSSTTLKATVFHCKVYVLILAKNGLGYILADFLTNSSGHPGGDQIFEMAFSKPACAPCCIRRSHAAFPCHQGDQMSSH
jgi:hypothetical protein